jgi:hypothetical protein
VQQQQQQQVLQQPQQPLQQQPLQQHNQQHSTAALPSDACRVPPLWRTHHIFSSTVTDPCPQQLVQGSWMNAAKVNGVGGVLPYTAQVRAAAAVLNFTWFDAVLCLVHMWFVIATSLQPFNMLLLLFLCTGLLHLVAGSAGDLAASTSAGLQ